MLKKTVVAIFDRLRIRLNPCRWAEAQGVKIGSGVRLISLTPGTFGSEPYLITLGNDVTVSGEVQFITHDGGVHVLRGKYPDIDIISPIKVGNNVFIGFRSIIMPGVSIGNNVVIGAGSLVTKDVQNDSIVCGVPAKKIHDLDHYEKSTLQSSRLMRLTSNQDRRAIIARHCHNFIK